MQCTCFFQIKKVIFNTLFKIYINSNKEKKYTRSRGILKIKCYIKVANVLNFNLTISFLHSTFIIDSLEKHVKCSKTNLHCLY